MSDLAHLSYTSPTFNFESALYAFSDLYVAPGIEVDGSIFFSAGCLVKNTSNCTAACQNASLIFTNPYTMQNCMVLASLGRTEFDSTGSLTPLQNHTFSPHSVTIAKNFSIDLADPGFPSSALRVNKTISECLQQYCNNENGCLDGDGYYGYCSASNYTAANGSHIGSYCYPDICPDNGSSSLNPDIGGIGVRRSFLYTNLIALSKIE